MLDVGRRGEPYYAIDANPLSLKPAADTAASPTLMMNLTYPNTDSIDISASLDQDGYFSCVATEVSEPVPEEKDFVTKVNMVANTPAYFSVPGLESDHAYKVYCLAYNKFDVVMTNTIESTMKTATTASTDEAPVLVIGRIDPTVDSAVATLLSTLSGNVYCITGEASTVPSRLEIKEKSSPIPIASYSYATYSISGLTASTKYALYCTSETNKGVPMLSAVDKVAQEFTTEEKPESLLFLILRIVAALFCLCMSGLFSGLNLGLMGLDLISLQMISETNIQEIAGDSADPEEVKQIEHDKMCATKILPIRRKGNLLLCTLLIGNVMVNSLISILTADMTSGTVGFILSTIFITAFGEIIPQAYGSRHGLDMGAMSIGVVKVIIGILYIICKPVSMLLDWCLGDELGNIYNRYQLYTMFELYKDHSDFKKDTISTMQGALVMDTKNVGEFVHAIDNVFMLSDTAVLDYVTCMDIFRQGYSRIPVYHNDRQNIVGVLYVKELIMIDPNQSVTVESLLKLFPRSVLVINAKRTLSDAIKDMVQSHTELAFVSKTIEKANQDNTLELVGIVTLEDLIKAVMRLNLVDETPMESRDASEALSNVFSHVVLNHMDPTTMDIISHFIAQSFSRLGYYLPQDVIHSLITKGAIKQMTVNDPALYEVNKSCDFMTVVLQGVFTMVVGEDKMTTEKPVFSVVNAPAVIEDYFV